MQVYDWAAALPAARRQRDRQSTNEVLDMNSLLSIRFGRTPVRVPRKIPVR
jgi:hypothetical protein